MYVFYKHRLVRTGLCQFPDEFLGARVPFRIDRVLLRRVHFTHTRWRRLWEDPALRRLDLHGHIRSEERSPCRPGTDLLSSPARNGSQTTLSLLVDPICTHGKLFHIQRIPSYTEMNTVPVGFFRSC